MVNGPSVFEPLMDGWMTCDFTSFSTVFQSYQDDERLIMKGCVQWSSVEPLKFYCILLPNFHKSHITKGILIVMEIANCKN